jgi:hypothetical protein
LLLIFLHFKSFMKIQSDSLQEEAGLYAAL